MFDYMLKKTGAHEGKVVDDHAKKCFEMNNQENSEKNKYLITSVQTESNAKEQRTIPKPVSTSKSRQRMYPSRLKASKSASSLGKFGSARKSKNLSKESRVIQTEFSDNKIK